MKSTAPFILASLLLLALACEQPAAGPSFDEEAERNAILDLHKARGRYLMNSNLDSISALPYADTSYIIGKGSVSELAMNTISKEDLARNYGLTMGKYLQVDDVQPPIIDFSKDGQMAWMVTNVGIVFERPSGELFGAPDTLITVNASLEVLEKVDGQWTFQALAQTARGQ